MTRAPAARAAFTRRGGRPGGVRRRLARTAWLFLLPAVVFFPLMFFFPLWNQLVAGLYGDLRNPGFIGLENYTRAVDDPSVVSAFLTTLGYATGSLVVGAVLGLVLALILHQALPGRGIFRSVLLIPHLTSVTIIALLWRNILDPNVGILNRMLASLDLPQQAWLTTHPLATIIGITVWWEVGYTMVLFLAGLQGVPTEYYEAAMIDGAGPWQRFWSITLPLLAPTTLFVTVVGLIGALQQFALPYLVTGGGPGDSTTLFALRVFRIAFGDNNFSYASALSMLMLIVILLLSIGQLRMGRRASGQS